MDNNGKQHVFDKPGNVQKLLYVLYVVAGILFVADFFIHRHVVHPLEQAPGFYAIYGFIGIVVLVLLSKELRKLVMRSEDYYDE